MLTNHEVIDPSFVPGVPLSGHHCHLEKGEVGQENCLGPGGGLGSSGVFACG